MAAVPSIAGGVAQEPPRLAPASPLDREIFNWLLLAFFALFVLGFWLLRLPGAAQGNPQTIDRAIFQAVSALSLTGLQLDVQSSSFAADSALVPAALLVLVLGGSWLTLVSMGLPAVRLLGIDRSPGDVCRAAAYLVFGAAVAGGLTLYLLLPVPSGDHGPHWLNVLLLSASALGNAGTAWGPVPRVDSAAVTIVLLPLSVAGGLGLPVLFDLSDRLQKRSSKLRRHTRLVLGLVAVAYLGGFAALLASDKRVWELVSEALFGGGLTPTQWRQFSGVVIEASAYSINARSGGFLFGGTSLTALPRATQGVVALLMLVGAGPSGTAGGLRTTVLHAIGRTVFTPFGSTLREGASLALALRWSALLLVAIAVPAIALLASATEMPTERVLVLAVSAATGCGLSHDPLALTGSNLIVLAVAMGVGRIMPLWLLWRFAEQVDRVETVVL